MDAQSLAVASAQIMATLLTGVLQGAGERIGNELYSVVARRLRGGADSATFTAFEQDPATPAHQAALVSTLVRQLDQDQRFRTAVDDIVRRAVAVAPSPVSVSTSISADRGSIATGGNLDQSRRTNFGGVVVGVVAVAVVLLVLLLGRTVVNFVRDSGSGLSGDSTCRDFLASSDTADKAAVMKRLYLEQNKSEHAADPFIIQNTEYFCGQRPGAKLKDLATARG